MGVGVRELTPADSEPAARALGDAFAADPLLGWMGRFTEDGGRVTTMARAAIRNRWRTPTPLMFTTDDTQAVALWNAPSEADLGPLELLRAAPAMVRTFRSGLLRTLSVLQAMENAHPTEEHYYLFMVGVHRGLQGTGLGSAVLAPMLQRCDTEGVPAYLENTNPVNDAFYARHGFTPLEPLPLPSGAPTVTPMWRDPR